jgi:hypothetical protein
MENVMGLKTYRGSCHCGRVKYETDLDLAQGTAKCNCTYCVKVRAWAALVKPEAFRLISGGDALTAYHRNPQAPLKLTCTTCGVHTHATGEAPWAGGGYVSVFVNTLDDVDADELAAAPVQYFDGLHDNWRNPPEDVRML